jgi:hypothetical protein
VSAPFAKLFDTAHGQLLVFLDETDDSEPAITVIGAYVDDVRPQAKLSGWEDPEGGQARAFDKIDQASAEEMAARLHAMVKGLAA